MKININMSFENNEDLNTYLKENNVEEKDIVKATEKILLEYLSEIGDELKINNIHIVKNNPNNGKRKKKK